MRLLLLILAIQVQAQVCQTNWICTNGSDKAFIIPCSSINQSNYYTEHHLDFGDGSDTNFIGIYNPLALCYQTIMHPYNQGVYIATLTTSFYDSTTNVLLCTSTNQDTICNSNITYINEVKKLYRKKIYNLQGIELLKEPKNTMYIKNRKIYYGLCN
tara:strand:- start:308 stop:778 length:471 start_codon:yes stop_codon:yes gene_type:complete